MELLVQKISTIRIQSQKSQYGDRRTGKLHGTRENLTLILKNKRNFLISVEVENGRKKHQRCD